MGGASSMDWWEDGFCERLMAGSRFVIRYDPVTPVGSGVSAQVREMRKTLRYAGFVPE
jgi:hypothetical protein